MLGGAAMAGRPSCCCVSSDGRQWGRARPAGRKRHERTSESRRPRHDPEEVAATHRPGALSRRASWPGGDPRAPLSVFGCAPRVPVQSTSPRRHLRSADDPVDPRRRARGAPRAGARAAPDRGRPTGRPRRAGRRPRPRGPGPARVAVARGAGAGQAELPDGRRDGRGPAPDGRGARPRSSSPTTPWASTSWPPSTCRQQPPNLPEAKVAIDAFGALLEALRAGSARTRPPSPRRSTSSAWPSSQLSSGAPARATAPDERVTVLVTGGAGYIGSHTVRLLRERGRDVVVLDSWSSATATRCSARRWSSATSPTPSSCSATVAEHGVDGGHPLRRLQGRRRVDGAAGPLLRATTSAAPTRCSTRSALAGVDKVVFSSTCAVYGTPDEAAGRRGPPARPREPLRREQAHGRADARAGTTSCHGLRSVSLRYFNAAGASADGRIGEDWTVHAEPGPARDEGRPRPHPRGHGVRHRLPHARRHRDPRLRPRRGPRRRPPPGPRVPRGRRARPPPSTSAPAPARRCAR